MISDENDREISPLTSSQMVKKIYATKKEQVLQITTRKSRETAWVSVKRSVITSKADDEKLFLEVYNNITPSKELDSRKDEFISLASHELRTPLTSMRLFLDLLGKHVQTIDDKKIALFTQKARDQATRLNKLVTELFDISRIQKGKLSINTEKIRLDEILESTVSDLQMITPTHKIELSSCPKALVIADKYRIYQVLINLINNAVKHSSDGQRIIVSLKKSRHYAQIGVRDFGVGIPHDKQELIFERFYQIRNNSGKQVSGLGIGLFIANEIVRSHHGKMWVKSKVGQGSTFFFTLPLLETSVSPQKIGQ